MFDEFHPPSAMAVAAIFAATYAGMAVGRVPGLRIDRTGIGLLAAILLVGIGAMDEGRIVEAIDFPTIIILFGLMILSAQFAASGFYDWCSLRIATAKGSPVRLLAVTIATTGALSAILVNDVVVFAMAPLLCAGLKGRGLDPRPFLIGLAGAANAGSAATIIGNPQNIVIGQVGQLNFWNFLAICGVPAAIALVCVHLVVWFVWRNRWHLPEQQMAPLPAGHLDRPHLIKALLCTGFLLVFFATPLPDESLPDEVGVLFAAGAILVSRRLTSRQMLGMVDWQLLVLFVSLFIVTDAMTGTGLPARLVEILSAEALLPDRLAVMAPMALVASNTIGNVPAVVLFLSVWPEMSEGALYSLAVLSTLAGNLLLIGSLANLIVAERALLSGVKLGFLEHARCGIPITLLSFVFAVAWLWLTGMLPLL